jgi:hypothetical protein
MRKILLSSCFILILSLQNAHAQLEFGVKLGIHSMDLSNPLNIILPDDGSIAFKDAKLGFQGGIYTKIAAGNIFIEPRLMLHSSSVQYTLNGENGGLLDNIKDVSFTNLDIPLLLGFDVLFLDAVIGPVAHINLDSSSDLFDINGYDERFKTASYGFRAGFSLSLGNIDLSMEYEGNFSNFGDHIVIGGQEFSFNDKPSRLIFNIGIPIF